jgi:YegS/Rv2252/BmrU family lipid kinase
MVLDRVLGVVGGPRLRAVLVGIVALCFVMQRRLWSAVMLVAATGGMGAINSGLKALVRRQRPKGIPGLRQAGGYSFPSGHSSGSVVFLGALVYLSSRLFRHRVLVSASLAAAGILAGAIGRSRVGLRAHHRSDVLAGFGIGAAWLAIVLRMFSRPLDREYNRPRARKRMRLPEPPLPVVLVTSPASGRAKQARREMQLHLRREGLHLLDEIPVKDIQRLERWIGDTAGETPLVVAAGGDGTVGAVAGCLVDTDAILGIVPAGTSNDIARSLGLPLKIDEAVRLLRHGSSRRVDVGCFERMGETPHYFVHAATAGINVAFARLATQSSFRRRLGKLTYAIAGLAALRDARPFGCDIEIDGRRTSLQLLQICVVNAPVFGGLLGFELPGSHITDDRLDVLTIEAIPLRRLILTAVRIVLGRRAAVQGIRVHHTRRMDVKPCEPQALTLDGEIAAALPGAFSLRPGALRVMCPQTGSQDGDGSALMSPA